MTEQDFYLPDKAVDRASKSQLREAVRALRRQVEGLQAQKDGALEIVASRLALHMPAMTQEIDLSTVGVDEMRDEIAERIGTTLFCAQCSHRWPCAEVDWLSALQGYLRLSPSDQFLQDIKSETVDLSEAPKRPNVIPVRM